MKRTVPVLYYHRVNEVDKKLAVRPELFRAQLERLSRKGWRALTIPELRAFLTTGKLTHPRSLVITFDDGYADNWYYAFPALEQTGMKAIIFIVTDWVREEGEPRPVASGTKPTIRPLDQAVKAALAGDYKDFLRPAEVRAMVGSGVIEVASHTRRHRPCFAGPRLERLNLSPSPHWARTVLLENDLRPGAPLFEWASEVAVPCFHADPELKERLVEFLASEGGAAAVKRDGKEFWTKKLLAAAARRQGNGGNATLETREQAETRIRAELSASRLAVEAISGRPAATLCWPWGHYSELGIRAAKASGYLAAFSTETGAVRPGDDPFRLPRVRVSSRTGPAALEAMLCALSRPAAAGLARRFARSGDRTRYCPTVPG